MSIARFFCRRSSTSAIFIERSLTTAPRAIDPPSRVARIAPSRSARIVITRSPIRSGAGGSAPPAININCDPPRRQPGAASRPPAT
ncbi:MAG: hypothetical protein ACE5JH_02750 [Acidobacteriota bacterium]